MNPPSLKPRQSEYSPPSRGKNTYATLALICAIGTVSTIITGLATCTWIILDAFRHLGQTGNADPSEVAGDVSYVLLVAFYGFVNSMVFLIPCIIFLILHLKNCKQSGSP